MSIITRKTGVFVHLTVSQYDLNRKPVIRFFEEFGCCFALKYKEGRLHTYLRYDKNDFSQTQITLIQGGTEILVIGAKTKCLQGGTPVLLIPTDLLQVEAIVDFNPLPPRGETRIAVKK